MQIKYDSLSRLDTPKFFICSPGSTYDSDTGAISKVSGILTDKSDENITINFNDLSELSFRAYRYKHDNDIINENANMIYKSLKNRRMIFLDGFGYFIISNVTESCDENNIYYKDVTANSVELEIQNKMLTFIDDGTYRFSTDPENPDNVGLFDTIMTTLPMWHIGYVSQIVASRYRSFEDVDTESNVFGFMIEEMEKAYECIFEFDTINRIINVYDQSEYSEETSIHLTKDDFIKTIDIEESSEDLYTAIRVYGDDNDVNISAINPLGNSVIYNLDYYLSWMSSGLRDKVSEWQDLLKRLMEYGVSVHFTEVPNESVGTISNTVKLRVDNTLPTHFPAPSPDETEYYSTPGNIIYVGSNRYEIVSYDSGSYTITLNEEITLGDMVGVIFISEDSENIQSFYERAHLYYTNMSSQYNYSANMDVASILKTMYQRCRDNIVASASDDSVEEYNDLISKYGGAPVYVYDWQDVKGSYVLLAEEPEDFTTNYSNYYINEDDTYIPLSHPEEWGSRDFFKRFAFQVGDFSYDLIEPQTVDEHEEAYFCRCILAHEPSDDKRLDNVTYWARQTINTEIKEKNIDEQIAYTMMAIDTFINTSSTDYDLNNTLFTNMETTLEDQKKILDAVRALVNVNNFFTEQEYDELYNYIYEGSYSDEYVTITDNMTYLEKFNQMKILYDRSVEQLKKISTPNQSFTLEVNDFIFSKEFSKWAEELKVGCSVNVEVDNNDVAQLFLSQIELNFSDRYMKLTFGNRIDKKDLKSLFQDVFGNVEKSQNTLSYIREIITPVKNGEINRVKEALSVARDLTKDRVLSSENEQVIIDDNGYTGRRLLSDSSVSNEQIKINAENIVFTDDAWDSSKTAIGKIILEDGSSTYGINAETISGNLLLGNELRILDNDGNDVFSVVDDKITSVANNITTVIADNIQDPNGIVKDAVNGLISTSIDANGQVWNFINQQINPITQRLETSNKYIRFNGGIVIGDESSESTSLQNSKLRLINDIVVFFDGDEDITKDDVIFRSADNNYESYVLLLSQEEPSDWNNNQSKYYYYNSTNQEYYNVALGTPYSAGTYYKKREYSIYSYFSTDSFYDDNLIAGTSLKFGNNDGFIAVPHTSTAPVWQANKYYKKSANAEQGVFTYTKTTSQPSDWYDSFYKYYEETNNYQFVKQDNGHLTLERA